MTRPPGHDRTSTDSGSNSSGSTSRSGKTGAGSLPCAVADDAAEEKAALGLVGVDGTLAEVAGCELEEDEATGLGSNMANVLSGFFGEGDSAISGELGSAGASGVLTRAADEVDGPSRSISSSACTFRFLVARPASSTSP